MNTFASKSKPKDNADEVLKVWLQKDPNTRYTFDSERDAPVSEICREYPQSRECMMIQMNSKKLFESMQIQRKPTWSANRFQSEAVPGPLRSRFGSGDRT
ncbi:hypothetical protein MPER_09342 [Moniliophthora perniciosa FA553]|nr:hypothetical protein MPER_09342 [Moniliophthora perniciosa FA553]